MTCKNEIIISILVPLSVFASYYILNSVYIIIKY